MTMKTFVIPIVLSLGLAAGAGATPTTGTATGAPDPLTCEGYPEQRVFLESQSWWRRTPGLLGTDSGHVHSGACFPYLQTLSGTVDFDVRTLMHDNPAGTLHKVRVQAFNNAYGTLTLARVTHDKPCGSTDCTFWTQVSVDTQALPYDGLTEFRIHSEVIDADGSRNLATNGFLAYVRNGKSAIDTNHLAPDMTEGRGWYETALGLEFGYQTARLASPLPIAPVSGVWTPEVEVRAGFEGEPVTRSLVTIDPHFHAVPEDPGQVLVDQADGFRGPVSIDTTKLADGPHRLVIVSSADVLLGSTLSGVVVIPFTVANASSGEPPPTETPPPGA